MQNFIIKDSNNFEFCFFLIKFLYFISHSPIGTKVNEYVYEIGAEFYSNYKTTFRCFLFKSFMTLNADGNILVYFPILTTK